MAKNYKLVAEKSTKEAILSRKISTGIAIVLALLASARFAAAGRLTATVQGRVSDNQGFILNGAHIYVVSPSLIGVTNSITSESGRYVFSNLPPGVYRITVEMPGFKTVKAEGIVLVAGGTVSLDFKLEPTEIEEESVTRRPDVGLERGSSRLATVIDTDLLTHIPMPRDFSAVLGLVPGVVITSESPSLKASVHGAPVTGNVFAEDDINITDPVGGSPVVRTNIDTIGEVVVETAGLSADRDPGQGAYINVLRQSGANEFVGSLGLYYTGKGLARSLWSDADLGANPPARAAVDKNNTDTSLTLGGPVLSDISWVFSNIRVRARSQQTPFEAWTDPLNANHAAYDWKDHDYSGLFKLSVRAMNQYNGMVEVNFTRVTEPVYAADVAWNRPVESTHELAGQSSFLLRLGVVYAVDEQTSVDLSLRYAAGRQPLSLNADGQAMPSYSDSVTGRVWGSGPYNDDELQRRFRANVTLTRFQDRVLGANHELLIGGDYENGKGVSSVWKTDDLFLTYADGSPYEFGLAVSPTSGRTVGLGLVGFSLVPGTSSLPMRTTRNVKRLGIFARDTLTIGGRVSLSLGLRFDSSDSQVMAITKAAAGNPVAVAIGSSVIDPVFGINPFSGNAYGEQDSVMTWNSLSPRFGLNIDLLGTGRTFLRASYARLPEDLGLGYMKIFDPIPPDRVHDFYWYDENGDGKVDANDTFVPFPDNYAIYTGSSSQRMAPKLRAPAADEWTAGLDHEVLTDFTLSARYVSRSEKGGIGDVMYDPTSGHAWYSLQSSPAGWWVPFSTTVPASQVYPAAGVTVYLRSTAAPAAFDRIQSVPELGWTYRGLEFSLRKRMAHNWQLVASVVLSRTTGTSDLAAPLNQGIASPVLTPNSFVNVGPDSRTSFDRPLAIRVMGTVRFKYDFYLSAYYRFLSGEPYARTVTIIPPASWATANGVVLEPVTVYLESPGARRYGSFRSADLRLEKEFLKKGRTRLSAFVDVLNLFGNKNRIIDYSDGVWYPDGEGGTTGTRLLSPTYGQAIAVSGARIFALSVKLGF